MMSQLIVLAVLLVIAAVVYALFFGGENLLDGRFKPAGNSSAPQAAASPMATGQIAYPTGSSTGTITNTSSTGTSLMRPSFVMEATIHDGGSSRTVTYPLRESKKMYLVGRTEGDIILPEATVSMRHCYLVFDEKGLFLQEVPEGTTNGIHDAQGNSIEEADIQDGTMIYLGEAMVTFKKQLAIWEDPEAEQKPMGRAVDQMPKRRATGTRIL